MREKNTKNKGRKELREWVFSVVDEQVNRLIELFRLFPASARDGELCAFVGRKPGFLQINLEMGAGTVSM